MTTAPLPPPWRRHTARRPGKHVGWLPDGTPRYGPIGSLLVDGDRVCCHLCGRWFLSVACHLRAHGWNKADYLSAFGLELGNPLSGEATHERRSAAMRARMITDPAVRKAQQRGKERARSGALTAAAASAARGRPHSAERRTKTLATLSGVSPDVRARASVRRARQHLEAVADTVAQRFSFTCFEAYVVARLRSGMSLAAISREAGLHKDWLSRHLPTLAPGACAARHEPRPDSREQRWIHTSAGFGFADVLTYLRTRHLEQHRTVSSIAKEAGVSRDTAAAALLRHGIQPTAHAAKRHDAAIRDRTAAQAVGFDSMAAYVMQRRARGFTWKAMVAETGIPETSLRRYGRNQRTPGTAAQSLDTSFMIRSRLLADPELAAFGLA